MLVSLCALICYDSVFKKDTVFRSPADSVRSSVRRSAPPIWEHTLRKTVPRCHGPDGSVRHGAATASRGQRNVNKLWVVGNNELQSGAVIENLPGRIAARREMKP